MVVLAYLTHTLYKFDRSKKSIISFVLITSTIANIILFYEEHIGMGMKSVLMLLLFILALYFVIKLNILQSIISTVIFNIALAVGDISSVMILVKIYGYTHKMIKADIFLSMTSDLIIYGTVVIITMLIRLVSQSLEMTDVYRKNISMKTSLYMFATFVVVAINYSSYIKFINLVDRGIILINVVTMWLYLILSLYINFTSSALTLKEQQYDQQQDYIKTIDSLINEFRRLKHSYSNTIYSFYGYIEEKDIDGLKEYYSEIMDDVKRVDSNLLLALQRIKVYAVFGLLWNKINEAEEKGIEVGVQVLNEVYEVGMRLKDLCEILGNYLDNAIDGAVDSETKKLNISLTDEEGYLTIIIENTCEENIDIKKIQQKGFSTKGDNRGFGLSITNQLLSKYKNVLNNTVTENGIFKQEIIIKK
jgi:two-component system sensor histidine kinase AgrC